MLAKLHKGLLAFLKRLSKLEVQDINFYGFEAARNKALFWQNNILNHDCTAIKKHEFRIISS
jgi:hypothetical protein